MFELLAVRIQAGGPAMVPLLLLSALAPLIGLGLYLMGVSLPNKAWALRFAVLNLAFGIVVPLLAWGGSVWRMHARLVTLPPGASPALTAMAHGEMLMLPWAALLGSPCWVASGFALLGVALLRHPALAKPTAPSPLRNP